MKTQPPRAQGRRPDGFSPTCSSRTEPNPNRRICLVLAILVTVLVWCREAQAQDTPIAYQGRLAVGGGTPDPADRFDLRFRLYDAPTGGNALDEALAPTVATDTNGQFTVLVDTGLTWSSSFAVQWVELGARRSGTTNDYTPLLPRQQLTAVPKALHARQADVAASLTGLLSTANLPPNVARLDLPQVFTAPPVFSPASGPPFTVGITATVTQLSADLLDGLDSTTFWRRATNDGVGSLVEPEDRPVEVRVQNTRVLRLQKGDSNLGWSVVGGSAGNSIATGVGGAVIGGGRGNLIEPGAAYSSVLGGDANTIGSNASVSTIGGGTRQFIGPNSIYAGIFAGYDNVVSSNSRFAGVLLGGGGRIGAASDFAAVLSGDGGTIGAQTPYAAILSGRENRIELGANNSLVGGGQVNVISTQAFQSVLVGGYFNTIQRGGRYSALVGGSGNEIGPESYNAFLGGGGNNKIEFNAPYSAILGGNNNLVRSNASGATVPGGVGSVAGAPFAIAAGHNAKAEHRGSIVLADGQYADFVSSNANEFAVRAAGGVRLVTGGVGLYVDGQRVGTGGGTVVTNGGNADTLDGLSSEGFWKLAGNAGTTAGAQFVGTIDDEPLEVQVNHQRALRLEPTAGSPNVIAGHAGNSVSSGVSGAAIGGGGSPGLFGVTFPNRVTDNFGVVAGGFLNLAGTDNADVQDSLGATVAGGLANSASAQEAFTGGGSSNAVRALAGAIVGGQQNTIETNADFAAIPGGLQARASQYGQVAHASGSFSQPGDAQTSLYVLRGTTVPWSLTTTELGLDVPLRLDGDARHLRFPPRTTWTFDLLIVAEREDGASAGYQIQGVVKSVPADPVLPIYEARFVGTPRVTVLGEDTEVEEWAVEAVTYGDSLLGEHLGAGLGIQVSDRYVVPLPDDPPLPVTRWVATVRTAEVMF